MSNKNEKISTNIAELGIDIFDEPAVETSLLSLDKENHLLLFKVKSNTVTAKPADVILITTENHTKIKVKYTVYTVYDDIEKSEDVLLLCNTVADEIVVKAVFSADKFKTITSLKAIDWLYSKNSSERNNILKRINSSRNNKTDNYIEKPARTIQDFTALYELVKSDYTQQQQRDIEGMLNEYLRSDSDGRNLVLRRLDLILNTNTKTTDHSAMDKKPSQIRVELDQAFFGQDEFKDEFIKKLVTASYSKKKGFPIACVGGHASGRSYAFKKIAEILGRDIVEIDCSTAQAPDLVGHHRSYHNAKEGKLISKLNTVSNPSGVIIYISGLDSAPAAVEHGNVSGVVKALLDGKVEDIFLDSYISCEDAIIVLEITDLNRIEESIRKKVDVLHFNSYSDDDKFEISRRHTIPEFYKEMNLDESLIEISDDNLRYLIENFACSDSGFNLTKTALKAVFGHVLCSFKESNQLSKAEITPEIIDVVLKKVDKDSSIYTYHRNKAYFPPQISKEIEERIALLSKNDLDLKSRQSIERALEFYCKIYYPPQKEVIFDEGKFHKKLKNYVGRDIIKESIAEKYSCFDLIKEERKASVFFGLPGTGKTALASALANALNFDLVRVSCENIQSKGQLEFKILESIKAPCKQLILFDEIDKLDENLADSLLQLFDTNKIQTSILGEIDFVNCEFIMTANDLKPLSLPLLNRCEIFRFENYAAPEKRVIFNNIFKNISEESGIKIKLKADDLIDRIIDEYHYSASIRDLEKMAIKIVRRAIYKSKSKSKTKTITITDELVRDALGPAVVKHKIANIETPGSAIALAVNGYGNGSVSVFETALLENDAGSLTITGNADDGVREVCKVCMSNLKKSYPEAFKNKGLHIHLGAGESSTQKSGPSGGLAIYSALLSVIKQKAIGGFAFSGEISLLGNITGVGGIEQKALAAKKAGCHTVVIPQENMSDLSDEFLTEMKNDGVNIIPISHVSEINYIFE